MLALTSLNKCKDKSFCVFAHFHSVLQIMCRASVSISSLHHSDLQVEASLYEHKHNLVFVSMYLVIVYMLVCESAHLCECLFKESADECCNLVSI